MRPSHVCHVTVYREPGRYAGWPANYGIWAWDDEIVVGFTLGYFSSKGRFHTCDKSRPFVSMQARSLDGGESWDVHRTPCPTPGDRGISADEHMAAGLQVGAVLDGEGAPQDCPREIDFTHPDLALMCARSGLSAGARSWFYVSQDRCRRWDGPYRLPMFGQPGVAARTDYIVSGPGECTLFLTAAKSDGREGRVFCARTIDGGRSFRFLSWIGPEPYGFAIMPASVRLPSGRWLVAVRCRGPAVALSGRAPSWIDLYGSDDEGTTWHYMNRPVANTGQGGNPPTLMRLHDGRLCLTHGYRDAPYGIRARLSADDGETWGEEVVIRDDGGCGDLGYPRTVQRPDGTIVIVYYFNEAPYGDRYIAASLWEA